jgi:hypothetical protein
LKLKFALAVEKTDILQVSVCTAMVISTFCLCKEYRRAIGVVQRFPPVVGDYAMLGCLKQVLLGSPIPQMWAAFKSKTRYCSGCKQITNKYKSCSDCLFTFYCSGGLLAWFF